MLPPSWGGVGGAIADAATGKARPTATIAPFAPIEATQYVMGAFVLNLASG
jgi:hypothetical protein